MKKDPKRLLIISILSVFIPTFLCCYHHGTAWKKMDKAEAIMNTGPDSALTILNSIQFQSLSHVEEKARYSLLMSIALDKNYIDTTTFDILQPAIDYYPKNGTPDEQLRTYYYQGRIFMNRCDFDMAMRCFLKARAQKNHCKDSLTYANLLIAQGNLYYQSYQINEYIHNNLEAAHLYDNIGKQSYRQRSLIRALDGTIIINDKLRADSIMAIADSLVTIIPETKDQLTLVKLTYGIVFDFNNTIKNFVDTIANLNNLNDELKLNISLGYLSLGESEKANYIFNLIDSTGSIGQSHKYLSIKSDILLAKKRYYEAIQALKKYHAAIENENSSIYYQKNVVAKDINEIEINHLASVKHKDKQILIVICVVLILTIVIGIISYQLLIGKKNRLIAKQHQLRLQLENENLQKNNSVLELEKHNAELELEKQYLESENMRLKISQLQSEGEHLKESLSESSLSKPILDSIQERIEILNGLLAAKISDNDTYSKPYNKWINEVTEDRVSFMNTTRLAFRASHPAFMKYLHDHGLSEAEINYVCLYAIGLRGKEIGEYIKIKRHYHMSTDIRKKLGLKEEDTNLGLHIRNLMKKL